jgi:hypothetical protein
MAVYPTTYGAVYGLVGGAQMLTNRQALEQAYDAAILAADTVTRPPEAVGDLQICIQPSPNAASANAAVHVTRAGTVWHDADDVDIYYDYSHVDGGNVTPTKTRRVTSVQEMDLLFDATNTAANTPMRIRQHSGSRRRLYHTTHDFAANGIVVGMSMLTSGWNNSSNNTRPPANLSPAERRVIDAVGWDATWGFYVQWVQTTSADFPAVGSNDGGSTTGHAEIGWAHDLDYSNFLRSTTPNVLWAMTSMTADSFHNYDGYPNEGADASFINHGVVPASATSYADFGVNHITFANVTLTGEWVNTIHQNGGVSVFTATNSTIAGGQAAISYHDHGAYPAPGRAVLLTDCVLTCTPYLPAETAPYYNLPIGSGYYGGPTCGARFIRVTFENYVGTAARQYSSGSRYTDFGGYLPSHNHYEDCVFTFTHAKLVGYSAGSTAIITADAPVTCTITGCEFRKGVASVGPGVMSRCSTVNITNPIWENAGLKNVDGTSRRQTVVTVNVTGGSTSETRTGPTTHQTDAGIVRTWTNHAFSFATATPTNNVMVGGPVASYVLSGATLANSDDRFVTCTMTNPTAGSPLGYFSQVAAPGRFRMEGGSISGNMLAGFLVRAYAAAPATVLQLELVGVDLSGIAGASSTGRGITFDSADGNVPAGSVSGSGNLFAHESSSGGIRVIGTTPGAQLLEMPQTLDPVTRTASGNIWRLSPNHEGATIDGTGHSIYTGANAAAQDSSFAFEGQERVLVAGSNCTTNNGGNCVWMQPGARTPGRLIFVRYSAGVWTEFRIEASVVATDAVAAEPAVVDTGLMTVSHTGPVAVAIDVTMLVGGTATPAVDYTALSASATIPAGQASTTIAVVPLLDALVELPETVVLTVLDGLDYDAGAADQATVTIADTAVPATLSPAYAIRADLVVDLPVLDLRPYVYVSDLEVIG